MKRVFLYCVDCKVEMKWTGETLFPIGESPKKIYKCPQCGDKFLSKELFVEGDIGND